MTITDVIGAYVTNGTRKQSPRALADCKRLWALFSAQHGGRLVTECRPADLLLWVNQHQGRWRSDWTLMRVAATIKRPFSWALKLGLVDRNPFSGVTFPPGERGRSITDEEFRGLLRAASAPFRRVLIFQLATGARPCEMSAVEWQFIDLDAGAIVLHVHKSMRSRKDRAPRVIALTPTVVKLLLWLKRHQPASQFVFLNSRGRPWTRSALGQRIRRLRQTVGLPEAKLYGCRHRFASDLAEGGCELKALAELLGHTTTRMAEHYVHVTGKLSYLHRALEKRKRD